MVMTSTSGSYWLQRTITLKKQLRGCHYVTEEIKKALPEISQLKMGILHLFIQHTSATLTINESWDPSVTVDMEMVLNHLVPESLSYKHTCEGADDMPAHAKQALLGGPSITVPITNGQLALGTWQGIWLCEHRNSGSPRKVVATIQGCLLK
uniref:SJCHGC03858 protein n=1 Tax=Schistosoma japonicum TaxID=6182 RepID=Q5DB06_SCHJA|nr:SJCHGC03858 protein [Schistosoma japonicum]